MRTKFRLNGDMIHRVCKRLKEFDPNIVEIIQFGSSVYGPKYARDLDLLIFTQKRKEYSGYLECLDELDLPFDCDVDVQEVGKLLTGGFAWQVLGAHRIVLGSGECLRKATQHLGDPTFEEARSLLRVAKKDIELAGGEENPLDKDRRVRSAFDGLFHAARIASMVHLSTEETRWGRISRKLSGPYKSEFEEFTKELHLKYFYHGEYSKDRTKEEFGKWFGKVEDYIERLESQAKIRSGAAQKKMCL